MSSAGSGGGSITGSTGGQSQQHIMQGLGLDKLVQNLGQQFQQGQGAGGAIQPGQEGQMSPQQRLAQVMRMYSSV